MAVTRITRTWVQRNLPQRGARAHKGTFGRVLRGRGLARVLRRGPSRRPGRGAHGGGPGMRLRRPESVGMRLIGEVPELTMLLLQEEAAGLIGPIGWRRLASEAVNYEATVVGPGLGRQPSTLRRTRHLVDELRKPAVVDADGLNALADASSWWRTRFDPAGADPASGRVRAPDPGIRDRQAGRRRRVSCGEGSRGRDPVGPGGRAQGRAHRRRGTRWRRLGLRASRRRRSPRPAAATCCRAAIGALLAGGCEPLTAAMLGVALHGAAGLIAERRIGRSGTMARDIANLLPEAAESFRPDRDK